MDTVYELQFENIDEKITLADDQVVLRQRAFSDECNWVRAKDLEANDLILSFGWQTRTLKSISEHKNDRTGFLVWNIELDAQHTFFVGEEAQIIVHNAAFALVAGISLALDGLAIASATPFIAPIAVIAGTAYVLNEINEHQKKEKKHSRYDSNSGFDKQKKGTPGNNQAQNKQFSDATRGLSKDQKRRVHDEISGKNLGYHEIKEIAGQIKGSGTR